ncbi:MAG: ornithine--oxo-acid transaminase [Deltaproteobacteria bacterium]|nr:ornithine--oxo-acid transaminase [Deltaproteobacteria bacterium]
MKHASTEKSIGLCEKYGAHNYHPLDIVVAKARGIWVEDPEGNRYLDMLSAYSAVNQGHLHPKIVQTLIDQAHRVTLTSRAFHNDQLGPFLEKICHLSDMDLGLPMNSGAEAVETAIKTARKWGYEKKKVEKEKAEIIVCSDNFHGRTTTVISFSSDESYKKNFGPFTPGFKIIPYGDAKAFEGAITPNIVAFLVEPIQGEAGIKIPPQGYLKKVRKLCSDHNILLMVDEIQTGLGRTGKLFAFEYENIKPDVLILGKALGGGILPISIVLSNRDILGVFKPGDHGSTFGGNPLACAVAQTALDVIIEEKLVENSQHLGAYFIKGLQNIKSPYVKEVRGRGLFIGAELKPPHLARTFCENLKEEGILCKETHETVIRFAPPLIIQKNEIDWALSRIAKILK